MRFVAVGERRLRVGGGPAYLAAVRKLSDALADVAGRHELSVAVADDDPDCLLVLARWTSPAAFEAAFAQVPTEVRGELEALERRVDDATWNWYRVEHEIQDMGARPTYVVAIRFRIADVEQPDTQAWMAVMMAGAGRLDGVASVARLRASHAEDTVLVVLHYTDRAVALRVQRLLASHPPPRPFAEWARFAGRIDLRWEHAHPR